MILFPELSEKFGEFIARDLLHFLFDFACQRWLYRYDARMAAGIDENPAVALGKLRAKTLTRSHQSAAARARAASMTPERRAEIAKKGALAKAQKNKSKKKTKSKSKEPQ